MISPEDAIVQGKLSRQSGLRKELRYSARLEVGATTYHTELLQLLDHTETKMVGLLLPYIPVALHMARDLVGLPLPDTKDDRALVVQDIFNQSDARIAMEFFGHFGPNVREVSSTIDAIMHFMTDMGCAPENEQVWVNGRPNYLSPLAAEFLDLLVEEDTGIGVKKVLKKLFGTRHMNDLQGDQFTAARRQLNDLNVRGGLDSVIGTLGRRDKTIFYIPPGNEIEFSSGASLTDIYGTPDPD